MKSSREKEKENDRCISSHMQTLHRRLLHALNLGTRHFDEKTNRWNWQCANIEVQKNVLRSIGAFLDSLSGDARAARHAIVKESVADSILGALLWILQCKKVATPCAIALNLVISNLSATSEKAVMEALNETETSIRIVRNIKFFAEDAKKIEYFKEMTLLLSAILWRWPPSRFSVALCDSVARKLIEDGEGFPQMVVQAMGKSNPHAVQIEGLSFVDTLEKWCRICQKDIDDHFQSEPVSRAVLMMIHSPCNTISSYARFLLLDALEVKGLSCLKSLIHTLDYTSSLESYGSFDKLQLVINLIGLTCLSSLPEYQSCIIESKGIKAIVLLVKRCLSNDIHVERRNFTPHLHTTFQERSCCCMDKEDWEGSNVLLFYSLLGLSEILRQCDLLQDNSQQYSREVTNIRAQLVSKLHEICSGNSFREETVKKLKILAKRCKLQHLLQMLYRQRPKDAILEAKSNKLVGWTCNICSDTVPHMHVHKVILQSGCDYLQGLFRSGMRESHSQVIKVDISWEALIKLVQWFYSDELPNPPSGCLWDNMDDEEKLFNLQPYVELCWLAEFWILENIQEACWDVIMSCLDSSSQLPIKIIKMAYNHSLWKLVDVAANLMAPSYRQLQNSGELEEFDDALATAGPEVRRAPSFKASKTICSGGGIHDANNLLSEIFYPVPANNYVIHQHQT
ncbi:BTB/POZ domain-containing protein [Glycine max]|nr:BTB/POZ domain-containing protein [Glycine max]